jgi:hypothetical protein
MFKNYKSRHKEIAGDEISPKLSQPKKIIFKL